MAVKRQVKAPSSPGVYFFSAKGGSLPADATHQALQAGALGGKNKILYIGKAANLKARLNSYHFGAGHLSSKIKSLLKEASSISWKILSSETEALIKESELIKKYQPKYNVLMRDDKNYFYAGFTRDKFPKIFLTHQTPKGPEYIGPFTDGVAIKSVLKLLRRVFPYCTCKKSHKNLCLNARIERCLGYCCNSSPQPSPLKIRGGGEKMELSTYRKNIKSIKAILTGKNKSIVKSLKVEMKKLSSVQKYEEAGKIRDQIRAMEKIFAHKKMVSRDIISENIKAISTLESLLKVKEIKRIEAYDIANIQGKYAYGSMAVFIDGTPAKDLYRIFKIKSVSSPNDIAMLKEVISRRFQHKEWRYPDLILVDGGKAQLNTILDPIPLPLAPKIIALTKNKKHIGDHIYISGQKSPIPLDTLPLPLKNLLLHLDSEAHRFAIKYYRKYHRKTIS